MNTLTSVLNTGMSKKGMYTANSKKKTQKKLGVEFATSKIPLKKFQQ